METFNSSVFRVIQMSKKNVEKRKKEKTVTKNILLWKNILKNNFYVLKYTKNNRI